METHAILGWAFVAAGVADIVLARTLLAARIPDPAVRRQVTGLVQAAGGLFFLLGGAFLFGYLPI